MAASPKADKVSFINIQKSYPPGEKLELTYQLHNGLNAASRDWVGVFRVGWSSSRDYYTFEWAPTPVENKGVITFAGQRLPPEDRHFYQFCFVSSDGRVRGASSPFQFSSSSALNNMDDMELVEVAEDSLMILQPKEKEVELVSGLEEELVSVKESVSKLETEKESLLSRYEVVEQNINVKSEQLTEVEKKLTEQEVKNVDLEKQLQAKRESEARLMEKLERERALNHDLVTAKSSEEAEAALLSQQLVEQENMVADLKKEKETVQQEMEKVTRKYEDVFVTMEEMKGEKDALANEIQATKKQNEVLCAKYEEVSLKLNELQELGVDMLTEIGEKNQEVKILTSNNEELCMRHTEAIEKLTLEKDQILQELSIAQQNIAELLGAKRDGIEINVQEPPTGQEGMVDRSAYEALQQASEEIEKRLQEANENLRSRLYTSQTKHEELVHRIKKCREEYEAKCKEVIDLQRQLPQSGGSCGARQADIAVLELKIREMEENQEQVTQSWENAIEELASRKEEAKMKEIKISELENEVVMIQKNFEEFQDKHDEVCHTKTAKMGELQAFMDEKVLEITELHAKIAGLVKDNAKLKHTVTQLREQLGTLKTKAKSPERSCPVCSTKFPGRISQGDYERHVSGHFQQD